METTLLTQLYVILLTITSKTMGIYIWAGSFLFCNVWVRNFRHLCGVVSLSCQYICMYVKLLLDARKVSFIFTLIYNGSREYFTLRYNGRTEYFTLRYNGSTEYFTRKKPCNNNYISCNIVRCNRNPATLHQPRHLPITFVSAVLPVDDPPVILNQKERSVTSLTGPWK